MNRKEEMVAHTVMQGKAFLPRNNDPKAITIVIAPSDQEARTLIKKIFNEHKISNEYEISFELPGNLTCIQLSKYIFLPMSLFAVIFLYTEKKGLIIPKDSYSSPEITEWIKV